MIGVCTGVLMPERTARHPPRKEGGSRLSLGLLIAGLAGALLILVSQFATLATERVAGNAVPVDSVTVGSDHSYALLPLALLAIVLVVGVWRVASRPALLALGVLGAISLVIALAHDLPDARGKGYRLSAGHLVAAANTPSAGLYLETAGALLLLITCVSGFLLLGAPRPMKPSAGPASPAPRDDPGAL